MLREGEHVSVMDNGDFVSHHHRYDPRGDAGKVIAGQAVEAGATAEELREVMECMGFDIPNPTPAAKRLRDRPGPRGG